MNCKTESYTDELKKKIENEFSEFLIQKISHAGGSLLFQHLSGLLPQLRFDIRETFGTKPELMKFLKAHPKNFKVDSKGVVTLISSNSFDNCDSIATNNATDEKPPVLPEIKNGQGVIAKKHPEFAIIKAEIPIRTYVHFTPEEFGATKDSLFIDQEVNLELNTKVCFNAVYGHDCEIEYRATKVWIEDKSYDDSDDNSDFHKFRRNKSVQNKLSEEGFTNKPSPKIRDHAELFAEALSEAQCYSTEVIKKTKKNSHLSSASDEAGVNTHVKHNIAKKKLENQPGKICPYSHGAVIKFGKDFSELADGNSSTYFLYGSEVSDIKWEFSEGDDVRFDAIETKRPSGWKAVLVWVGEKPNHTVKYHIDEDSDDDKDQNYNLSDALSETSNSSIKPRAMKHNVFNKEARKLEIEVRNRSNSLNKKLDKPLKEYRTDNLQMSKANSHKVSFKKSRHRKSRDKSYRENSSVSNYTGAKNKSMSKVAKISNPIDENFNSLHSFKKPISDTNISENFEASSEEDNEIQNLSLKKFLKKDDETLLRHTYRGFSDEISSSCKNVDQASNTPKIVMEKKASIKRFEDISGEIFQVHCKAAFIKCSYLEKDIDFVLNAFYLNGISVEEQQVIDLKEILKIGDTVNFNCFEIIDNIGEIYQHVTMAWKGSKPIGIYEISPEEFIVAEGLSVNISNELHNECSSENEMLETNFNEETSCTNSEISDTDFHSETMTSDNNLFDDTSCKSPVESENEVYEKQKDHSVSPGIQHKLLSEKIIQRLRSYDCVSSDSEVNLNIAYEIVNLVQKEFSVKGLNNLSVNEDIYMKGASENICSSCTKRSKPFSSTNISTKNVETQTIITGEVVALSIYTKN